MISLDQTQSIADAWHSGHLIGAFELRGAVSRSASGIVYRAWDHGLAVPVAVKEHFPTSIARRLPNGDVAAALPNANAAYENSLQAFLDGTRALAQCDHPALVRVVHLQTGHGTAYRIMPWVDGDPLRKARQGMSRPTDEPALRALLDALLGALEAVHRAGIVHGGVHPSQILLLRDDRPILLGPCAVAAEAGRAPGPWTDLRALAEVARFCISGMLPTADGGPAEPTAKIVERLFFDDPAVRYGQDFMRVLDAAASRDVAQRPQSVAQFRERLRQAARVDTGTRATDRPAPAGIGQPAGERVAHVAAAERAIQRVMEAVPSREPGERPRPRPDPEPGPIELLPQLGSTPVRSPAQPMNTWPSRRERFGPGVFAVLIAAVGFGAWQWLHGPEPKAVAPAVSDVATPAPSVVASPAPMIAAPPPKDVPPVAETVMAPAVTEAAPPVEAATVEPKSAPAEPAADRPAPVRSPREACGERTRFSLYRCMQQQCARTAWASHPQCLRFRATDAVE